MWWREVEFRQAMREREQQYERLERELRVSILPTAMLSCLNY